MIPTEGRYVLMDSDETLLCMRDTANVAYVAGKPVKTNPLRFSIIANVQPQLGQSLRIVPEGDRTSDGLVAYVPETEGMTMIQLNDKVLRMGLAYQCQQVANWGSFSVATLRRIDVAPEAFGDVSLFTPPPAP